MTKKCPLTGDECWEHGCTWFIQVMGKNPQTGENIDRWGCAVAWLPVLQVEGAQMSRQAGAAVESMRNEIVTRMDRPILRLKDNGN